MKNERLVVLGFLGASVVKKFSNYYADLGG